VTSTGQIINKRTEAFDFYLDLIAGHIIPMQNATALANADATTPQNFTTASLQKEKVDIHVLPLCGASGAACTA
jgi:hypothetical protein